MNLRIIRRALLFSTVAALLLVVIGLVVYNLFLISPDEDPSATSSGEPPTSQAARDEAVDESQSGGPLPQQQDALGDWVVQPSNVQELVFASDLIVIGQFTDIASTDVVMPTGYVLGSHEPEPTGVTFTNIEFTITRYLVGSGPEVLLVRQMGDLVNTDGPTMFPKPEFNRPILMFLVCDTSVPDSSGENVWWSHLGMWGRMSTNEEEIRVIRYEDGSRTPVPFLSGLSMDEAIDQIVEMARAPQ